MASGEKLTKMKKGLFLLIIVAAGFVWGCAGERSVEMGPAETVEAFCKAVAAGDWSEARELCDTVSMKEYLDIQQEAWNRLGNDDSSIMAIAKEILAETSIKIDASEKEEDKRIISYTLAADGLSKKCKATLKKEEGAWRVEKIQDAN